jgi:hypothetical protein
VAATAKHDDIADNTAPQDRHSCVAMTGLLAACTGDHDGGDDAGAARSVRRPPAATRTCGTAAFGPTDAHPVVADAGPARAIDVIGNTPADASDPSAYEPRPGEFAALKLPVIVAAGATVTVSVPRSDQAVVVLLFGGDDDPVETLPSGDRLFRLDQGETSVQFEGCPDRVSPFTGYFLVAGPRCVRLDVQPGSQNERILVPFGMTEC